MLERLLGVTEHAAWDEALPPAGGSQAGGVVADYRLADTDVANGFRRLVDGWLQAKAEGRTVPADRAVGRAVGAAGPAGRGGHAGGRARS